MISRKIDLSTDCINTLTEEMREAMRNAQIGNDDLQEDPTINQLEKLAAEKMGKESALFLLNGTMANMIAMFTHCQKGDKIILEKDFHMYFAEIKGICLTSGVIPSLIESNNGMPNLQNIERAIKETDICYTKAGLICLENPLYRAEGRAIPPKAIKEVSELAHQNNIPVHLDGARIFNATLALNVSPTVLTEDVDSVMFCLAKTLAAPAGAILTGSKEFIERARRNRKILGGHMRQMGIMAAAGIFALEKMIDRLEEDHENARILGEGLNEMERIKIDLNATQTNKVYFDIVDLGIETDSFLEKLAEYDILGAPFPPTKIRFSIHYGINREDIYTTIEAVKKIVKDR